MLFGRKSRAVESAAKDEDVAWRLEAIGQNVATIRFTPDGQILSANPLFLAAVGYSAACDATGRRSGWRPPISR
ncbi:hypothetical protein [Pseudomonas aeruginosa]|uniref:hypothetical protein n=1 Tax=Pseudomonas aeruginosa TaxID=287 RepID=UPI003D767E28